MIQLNVNGQSKAVDVDPATPILWVVRENLEMTGTKFGCGIAQCGACTVHLDGKNITTIEGIASEDGTLHRVQQAWIEAQVPQCGYCQSGQIMSATALLKENPNPTDAQIDAAMAGNVCRCGMYGRIRQAIKAAAGIGQPAEQETVA